MGCSACGQRYKKNREARAARNQLLADKQKKANEEKAPEPVSRASGMEEVPPTPPETPSGS